MCFLHCRDVLNRNWRNVLLHGPSYRGCDLLWNLHRLHRWKILVDCGCRSIGTVLSLLGGDLRFGGGVTVYGLFSWYILDWDGGWEQSGMQCLPFWVLFWDCGSNLGGELCRLCNW